MSEPGSGMSSFMKAAIVVLAAMLIFGTIAIFAGWMWWKKNRTNIIHSTTNARDEGYKIGKQSTEPECFNIAVSRAKEKGQFTETITNGIFLGACLEKSKPSDGFCKDVPSDKEFTKSVRWRIDRCKQLNLENNTCSALLSVVQHYCHETRGRLGKNQ